MEIWVPLQLNKKLGHFQTMTKTFFGEKHPSLLLDGASNRILLCLRLLVFDKSQSSRGFQNRNAETPTWTDPTIFDDDDDAIDEGMEKLLREITLLEGN